RRHTRFSRDWSSDVYSSDLTFHLRQGVTWHDGQPFTAEDVAWTFENVTSQYGPRSAAAFTRVSEITVVDDHTIELTLTEPYGSRSEERRVGKGGRFGWAADD